MKFRISIFTITVIIYQVHAQICVSPGQPTVLSSPINGAYAGPVVATTIVDNSVSNALANTLQLLIVSDLIQSKLSSVFAPNLVNGLAPLLERSLCSPLIDVVTPCATPIEVLPPCVPVIETIAPNFYRGSIETITPNIFGGYTETILPTPNYCGGWAETITATPCGFTEIAVPNVAYGPSIATVTPNIYGGTPINNLYGCTEVITPTCGPNFYGAEVITPSPFVPSCFGGVEVLAPSFNTGCFGGVAEVLTNPFSNCYGGIPEIIAPVPQFTTPRLTEVLPPYGPNYYGGTTEVFLPYNPGCLNEVVPAPFATFYGGIPEVITPALPFNTGCGVNVAEVVAQNPFGPYFGPKEIIAPTGPFAPIAAEVLFPQAIPAQLACNFGYSPASLPCVGVNIEPLPFEPCGCGCNNFPQGLYF